jgi:hypothetical protein
MQKNLLSISLAMLLILITVACSEQEQSACDRYCDLSSKAAIQDAEDKLCEPYPSELNRFEASCDLTCYDVIEYVVDKPEKQDIENCLNCIVNNVATPREKEIKAAKETCFEICNTLGGYQFFYSFYVSPPWWDCE